MSGPCRLQRGSMPTAGPCGWRMAGPCRWHRGHSDIKGHANVGTMAMAGVYIHVCAHVCTHIYTRVGTHSGLKSQIPCGKMSDDAAVGMSFIDESGGKYESGKILYSGHCAHIPSKKVQCIQQWGKVSISTHAHTHGTHMHARARTCMQVHARARTCTHASAHACTHAHARERARGRADARSHAHVRVPTPTCALHTHVHIYSKDRTLHTSHTGH